VVVILGMLKLCIWACATVIGMLVDKELKREGDLHVRDELTGVNVLIGGLT
jgi:hypothetical protein